MLLKNRVEPLSVDGANGSQEKVVCSKTCYNKVEKSVKKLLSPSTYRSPWDADGKNGPDDPNTSNKVLFDWWMAEGNYSRFRGKSNNGKRKTQFADQLARMINATGVKVPRTSKQVLSKIQYTEDCWKKAYDFSNTETGQGLKEDDPDSFREAVLAICEQYFDLFPVMQDRASAGAKATNEDCAEESSESEMSTSASDDEDDSVAPKDGQEVTATTTSTSSTTVEQPVPTNAVNLVDSSRQSEESNTGESVTTSNSAQVRAVATGSKVTSNATTTTKLCIAPKAKKNSKSGGKKKRTTYDDVVEENIAKFTKVAEERRAERLSEIRRHNMKMESIAKWDGKQKELQYKMELLERYETLRSAGRSNDWIKKRFPDMEFCFSEVEDDEDDI